MKKLLTLLLLIALPVYFDFVEAADMVVTSGGASSLNIVQSGIGSFPQVIMAGGGTTNADNRIRGVVSSPGKISRLKVKFGNYPDNGAGTQSWVVTLQLDGVNTALTCTDTELELTCEDLTNVVAATAGQLASLVTVGVGGPDATNPQPHWTVQFDANTPGNTLLLGHSISNIINGANFLPLNGDGIGGSSTNFDVAMIIPTAGTLKNLYASQADPGSGSTYSWTVRKNVDGLTQTALTCTIVAGSTTCNDTANTVAVAAGEIYSMYNSFGGFPTPPNKPGDWGVTFTPDNPGEFVLANSGQDPSVTVTQYNSLMGSERPWGTEVNADQVGLQMHIKKLYARAAGALGFGNSMVITLRQNAVSTIITCTLSSGTSPNCSFIDTVDVFGPVPLVDDDMLATKNVPVSVPTQRDTMVSYLAYLAPKVMIIKY